MKNEITTMNRNFAEQRRTNDAETVEKAMEHKMLKPLTGALKDEKTILGALEQIVSRCCDGVQSYNREITHCVKKIRECGPGQYFFLARENATWMHFPSEVIVKDSDANGVWNYYKYSSDVSAYLVSVDNVQENSITGDIMRLDYPRCLEVLDN